MKYLILLTQLLLLLFTAVENKIPNVSNLVKKPDYNIKISETENNIAKDHVHNKYITTQDLTSEDFTGRLAQPGLPSKSDINFKKKIF